MIKKYGANHVEFKEDAATEGHFEIVNDGEVYIRWGLQDFYYPNHP